MSPRLEPRRAAPAVFEAMASVERTIADLDLDPALGRLARLHAAQLNGCGAGVLEHVAAARAAGESGMRLHLLPAWRSTSAFSERERAALAWTDIVTRLGPGGISDHHYAAARRDLHGGELVALTLTVAVANFWDRVDLAAQTPALASPDPRIA